MSYLSRKRQFITTKLKFKPKEKITPIIIKNKNAEEEEKLENDENQSALPLNEENKEKKILKEFISEKDLIRGLNPNKSYSKLSRVPPLPKEYKVYKEIKLTDNEKAHLQKIQKEKNKLTIIQKVEKWNFSSNFKKFQKLLTSMPEFNEMPRISGV
jgi:hypothetical protein